MRGEKKLLVCQLKVVSMAELGAVIFRVDRGQWDMQWGHSNF